MNTVIRPTSTSSKLGYGRGRQGASSRVIARAKGDVILEIKGLEAKVAGTCISSLEAHLFSAGLSWYSLHLFRTILHNKDIVIHAITGSCSHCPK